MPPKAEIVKKAEELRGSCWVEYRELDEDEVWKGRERGATWRMTKPEGRILPGQSDFSSLEVVFQGKKAGREKLRGEFVGALGEPSFEVPAARFRSQRLIWKRGAPQQIRPLEGKLFEFGE